MIDWTRHPWMRVVCARAMEGLVLVNRRESLLVNCAEVYSRYPILDAHHEQTKIKRYQSLNTALPHPTTKYPNVELFIVEKDNSRKLETMNVLITSFIRIARTTVAFDLLVVYNGRSCIGDQSKCRISIA